MTRKKNRVLIIGAYGLIGAQVTRHLLARGYAVTGLGRDREMAARVLPDVEWITRDLCDMQRPEHWADALEGCSHAVNCAGALQNTGQDDLNAVHVGAVGALALACAEAGVGLVQISAAGVTDKANTAFLATKARGDSAVRDAGGAWWVFRPGLVLAPTAYGGTLMLRMLAAVPWLQPVAMGHAPVQTVSVADVARAVEGAVSGEIAPGTQADLVESDTHNLEEVVTGFRSWLGFLPARRIIRVQGGLVRMVARFADALGWLGWRSPLRSTAMNVLENGVTGDAQQTQAALGRPALTLQESLLSMPAGAEDRLAARMALLMPVIVAVLALFWIASGVIGLISIDSAAAVLRQQGWENGVALSIVGFWALVDIALGGAICFRRRARQATAGMVAVSLIYLLSATILTPFLWLDPLGVLVKVIPAMALAVVARPMLEPR